MESRNWFLIHKSLTRNSNPNPLKINGTDSCLKERDSMSPEPKLILETGAENPRWKKDDKKEGKIKLNSLKQNLMMTVGAYVVVKKASDLNYFTW